MSELAGKIAIVTGATGGIGKEIAIGLARKGAHVVIGARNAERGKAAAAAIESAGGKATVMELDVASFASIRAFAKRFDEEQPALHILVNNAGVWFTDRRTSADGHELTLATNVLGPHLLTQLLVPKLEASAPARIVNIVSSIGANLEMDDLEFERRKYDGFKCYAQSKQALRMLTWGRAARLEGSGVTSNAAAPGFVKTDFNQHASGFVPTMINVMAKLFAVTPEKGAATPIWVASAPELEKVSAKYFDDMKEKDGKFRDVRAIAELERRCDDLIANGAPKKRSEASAHAS